MEQKLIATLVSHVVGYFKTIEVDKAESKTQRETRKAAVHSILMEIKERGPKMTTGEKDSAKQAFSEAGRKAGWNANTRKSRKTEFGVLLDNPKHIPDNANAWKKTVDAVRLAIKSPEEIRIMLEEAKVNAFKAIADAQEAYKDACEELDSYVESMKATESARKSKRLEPIPANDQLGPDGEVKVA